MFTGVVQATALAPTAAQAEVLAKAAVLSGPARAAEWLRHGGVIVSDDGSYDRVEPAVPAATGAPGLTRRAQPRDDVVEHRLALGLVEDLVEEAVVGRDRLVGGADPLAQHHAARGRAEPVGGAVEDERRHGDRADGRGEALDGVGELDGGARRHLAVVHQRI